MITNAADYLKKVDGACDYIRQNLGGCEVPKICIVLGSGLGPLADLCDESGEIDYADIPGFPASTAPGHAGKLIIGELSGKLVFMMKGRFHYYEGYEPEDITFYVRVMGRLGVKTLVLTNAAGGIGEDFVPPEFISIEDHISFLAAPVLRGPNIDEFGPRFPDQSYVYDREYLDLMASCADKLGIRIRRGIYAYTKGPQYETPAEIRALRSLGAICVGMSTVPEAIVASHMGMRVAALSCVTNMAAGITTAKLSGEEVIEVAGQASERMCSLITNFIKEL